MGEMEKMRSYLDSMAYEIQGKEALDLTKGRYPFVTLSRQTGAGGHSLASAIIRKLEERKEGPLYKGWQPFDRELCEMVCNQPGISASIAGLVSKEYHSEIEDILEQLIAGGTPQDVIMKSIFKNIRTLATFGKVVIVGRGGVCLTRSLSRGVHLRLVASLPNRIKRIMNLLNLSESKAKTAVFEQDKARSQLTRIYFNRNVDDPLLYDATWNTDVVPIDEIADLAVRMIEVRSEARPAKPLTRVI